MTMYKQNVFINEISYVKTIFCLLLLIRASTATLRPHAESSTDMAVLQLASTTPTPIPVHSCSNWTAAPEAAVGNCRFGKQAAQISCYGGMNNTAQQRELLLAEQLLLCGWPQLVFNPHRELQQFTQLRSLTIENSGFKEFVFDFPELFYLQAINISWTNLSHITAHTFKQMFSLKILDLRWNQLMQLEGPLLQLLPRSFEQLYLGGNPWNCTSQFNWMLLQPEKARMLADREELLCTDRKFKERQMLLVMHYELLLKSECESHSDLQNCSCVMHHIIPKSHIPLYTVNCSHLQFQRLPDYLPANTTTLLINNNEISDVNPLRDNPHYRHVVDVHLQHNLISNIDILEDTFWLEHFRLFNLRGNRLRKLQVYALDNALNENENVNLLLLSKNPWHCNCKFGMRLRELLTKYKDIVRDAWNVSCTYMQDDELRLSKVLMLSRQDICNIGAENETRIHYLDWLNGVMASLIILILGKLAYDYYFYKYHNRVPWIVLKLP
ncbi:protein singed wings 2 isoform X1 [Drosophila busckii]|nr:protein singed wings 2 isoform X1 [Drosophila busckii]